MPILLTAQLQTDASPTPISQYQRPMLSLSAPLDTRLGFQELCLLPQACHRPWVSSTSTRFWFQNRRLGQPDACVNQRSFLFPVPVARTCPSYKASRPRCDPSGLVPFPPRTLLITSPTTQVFFLFLSPLFQLSLLFPWLARFISA